MRDSTPEWFKNKRDKNEPEIIQRVNALGAAWKARCRHAGHDGLVLFRGAVYICEVKNPVEKWTLTSAEQAMRRWVEANGGVYWILEYPADVDDMLGAA